MLDTSFSNSQLYTFRFFYDLSFFLTINIITMNIVFGVIIDSFARLRDDESKLNFDKKNICFICSLSKSSFDHLSHFEMHIDYDHNPWNYLYFIYNIRFKSETERHGLEVYVGDLMALKDLKWVPMGRAACFKDNSKDKGIWRKIQKIDDDIKAIKERMKLELRRKMSRSIDDT